MNLKKLKESWILLPASKKRIILIGTLMLVTIIALSSVNSFRTSPREAREAQKKATRFDLVSPDLSKESWVEQGRREVNDLSETIRKMSVEQQKLRNQLDALQAGGGGRGYNAGTPTAAERELGLRQDLGRLGALPVEKGQEIYPPIPVESKIPGAAAAPPGFGISGPGVSIQAPAGQQSPPAAVVIPPASQGNDKVGVIEPRIMGSQKYGPKQDAQQQVKPVSSKIQEAEFENFYVPTSSHVKVKLLTGADAPTGPKAQGMPVPLIARVQDLSFLPNEMRQNIAGCYILAEGMGELASERVKIRGLNLSCVNHSNQQVIDEEVAGYFADIDGKNALRGRVVSKQGRFLSAALMASFIEGVGKAFQASTSTTFNTPYGTSEQSSLDSFQDGFKQGVGSGLGASAKKLSDFYLKMAEDMYPVIELQANMSATFIFLAGKRFQADKALFLPVAGAEKSQQQDNDL